MNSAMCFWRVHLTIAIVVALCSAAVADAVKAGSEQHVSAANTLPSLAHMLTIALKLNPDVRAAQAELDRARLQVVQELRAFREDWRAAKAVVAEVRIAQREVDRISRLGEGAIAGKKLREVQDALEVAQKRGLQAKNELKEMWLLLPHLLGNEIAAKSHDNANVGPDKLLHGDNVSHDYHKIPAPVEQMLGERLQLLAKIAKLQQEAYQTSEVDFGEVASAQRELLVAQLELAKSANERVKIRQDLVQASLQIEEVTKQLFKENEVSKPDMLKATAMRLRAEADLKHEQLASDHQH